MAKYKSFIFLFLLIALFVQILIIFPNQIEHEDDLKVREAVELQKKQEEAGVTTPKSSAPAQKMQGVHLVESQSGNRDWELFAEEAEGSQAGGSWKLKAVKVFFYRNNKVEFTVVGSQGTIDNETKNISVKGNVVTKSNNGYTFETQAISYSSVGREILSPGLVNVTGPNDKNGSGLKVKGADLRVLVDESVMKISKGISAHRMMSDGKAIKVAADSVDLSGTTHAAKFGGKVKMTYDKMTIEGPSALFSYNRKSNFLDQIVFSGGVRVSEFNRFVTSDKLDLDILKKVYSFTGSPRLVQDGDELRGSEIVFLDGGKKVKVEKVRAKVENKKE